MATHVGESTEVDLAFVSASDQLIGALAQWERTPPAARAGRTTALVQLAKHRQQHLLQLLQRQPQRVGSRVMPEALRARLPPAAAAFVEQEVALQGTVNAQVADDFARGQSRTSFTLRPQGATAALELHLADATGSQRDLLSWVDRRVSLNALRVGEHLAVLDRKRVQLLAADSGGTTSTTTGTTTAAVQGEQTTLVVMGNFSDAAIACTATDLQSRLFGTGGATMNQGYLESSAGLVSFTGKVIGPFPIAATSNGSCDYNGWASALNSAAIAAGVNPSNYKRVSYATPPNANCGWSGLATLGGTPPTPSWIQACGSTGLFSHELGHNLKFHHAATPTSEYGDYSDPMGAARLVQSNAANRVMAGWISGSAQLQDVSVGGSYALAALEGGIGPRVLRMDKPDTGEKYYISMRQPVGIDSGLLSAYQNALSIHRATGTLPAKTVIVAVLAAGQSWSDSANGIQVVHQGVAGSTATVGVTVGASACVRNPPTVAIAPASQTGAAGATLSYAVSVGNRNSAACPASTFNLSQSLPAGFAGTFSAASLSLAPGATGSVPWSVGSATATTDGTYTLVASSTDTASGQSASAQASHIVYTAPTCTRGTPTVSVSPASISASAGATLPYTVTVTNTDSSGCGSSSFNLGQALPAGFAGSFGATTLAVAPGASASDAWTVVASAGLAGGTYQLTAAATNSGSTVGGSGKASAAIVATDTTPPTVVITSPAAGSVLGGRNASIAVAASDSSGIASVSFYADGLVISTDTLAPYTATWNLRKVAPGTHLLKARATDRAGNVAETSVSVTAR